MWAISCDPNVPFARLFCHLLFTRPMPFISVSNSSHSYPWGHVLLKEIPPLTGYFGRFICKFTVHYCGLQRQRIIQSMLMSLTTSYFLVSSGHHPRSYQLTTFAATPWNSSLEISQPVTSDVSSPVHDHSLLSRHLSYVCTASEQHMSRPVGPSSFTLSLSLPKLVQACTH